MTNPTTAMTGQGSSMFQEASGFHQTNGQVVHGNLNNYTLGPSPQPIISISSPQPGPNATLSNPQPSPSLPMPATNISFSESENYCSQMLHQKRGFPLYIPNPQSLPAEYQEHGIAIGDVGSVTADGEFDFYFNIFLPAEHPINAGNTPEDFSPMHSFTAKDIFRRNYGPGHYLSTPTVRKVDLDPAAGEFPGGHFAFRCDGPQGAILALPDGAHLQELRNVENMRTYAAKHAKSWYTYIKGTRGRRLTNGDLYLVTGCEKTRSWGMASYHTVHEQFQLFFKPTTTMIGATYNPYRWGGIPGQANPSRSKGYDPPLANDPGNQTIFIHGYSISLPTVLWGMAFGGVQTSSMVDFHSLFNPPDGSSATNSQGSFFSWTFNFFAGRGTTGGNRHAEEPRGVVLSDLSTPSAVFNPAKLINEYILYKAPQGTGVVMSHDDDWGSILGDATDLRPSDFFRRIDDQFIVTENNGEFREPRPLSAPNYRFQVRRFSHQTWSQGSLKVQGQIMFWPRLLQRPRRCRRVRGRQARVLISCWNR
ncbi:hypothetical protein DFH06DRAFT_152306 [Mycena polygramma]|nr:hypothetical protein DFH06DRAFT_152306 [Mycena polygramma]